MVYCSQCGQPILDPPYKMRPIHRFEAPSPFGNSIPTTAYEAFRKTPAREAGFTADVLVPLAQAGITGVISTLVGIVGAAIFHWPWYGPVIVGIIALALTWLYLLVEQRSLLWTIETITNQDLDGDGHTGKPAQLPAPRTIRAEVKTGPAWRFAEFPAPSERGLQRLARDIVSGRESFSERSANKHGYSREIWMDLRDEFLTAGLARWNDQSNPKQGLSLTQAGLGLLKEIAITPIEND